MHKAGYAAKETEGHRSGAWVLIATGCPAMTMLEKIIYIADYIEPGRRELPNMADVRQLAFRDIDECLYRILKDSLVYLDSKNITVDPMTQRTYDYYKKEMGKED